MRNLAHFFLLKMVKGSFYINELVGGYNCRLIEGNYPQITVLPCNKFTYEHVSCIPLIYEQYSRLQNVMSHLGIKAKANDIIPLTIN